MCQRCSPGAGQPGCSPGAGAAHCSLVAAAAALFSWSWGSSTVSLEPGRQRCSPGAGAAHPLAHSSASSGVMTLNSYRAGDFFFHWPQLPAWPCLKWVPGNVLGSKDVPRSIGYINLQVLIGLSEHGASTICPIRLSTWTRKLLFRSMSIAWFYFLNIAFCF